MNVPSTAFPKPTAQVFPYFDILGLELTVRFLLAFGGAEIYIPQNPCGRGRVEQLIGTEKTKLLAQSAHQLPEQVPLANPWLAAALSAQGQPVSEIARQLRVSRVTVRRYLRRYNM